MELEMEMQLQMMQVCVTLTSFGHIWGVEEEAILPLRGTPHGQNPGWSRR